MRGILTRFSSSPKIPHFRVQFPLRPIKSQQLIAAASSISSKSPALFVSINGFTEDAELCNTLHDAFKFISRNKKIPLYSFLQDNINGLGYYVATAGFQIHANPFCKIGDLTAPTKTYRNIQGLLNYFGVSVEKIGNANGTLWDSRITPTQDEKKFTAKWLSAVSNGLKKSIETQRRVETAALDALGSRLISPKRALQLKLVDSIATLQQFKETHFPNNKVVEETFTSKSAQIKFSQQEMQVLTQMSEWMEMPRVTLTTMEDPLSEIIKGFGEIVAIRLEDEEKLEELDIFAHQMLSRLRDLEPIA